MILDSVSTHSKFVRPPAVTSESALGDRLAILDGTLRYGEATAIPIVEELFFETMDEAVNHVNSNPAMSNREIFNTWPRTDGTSVYAADAAQGLAASWYYNSSTDSFVMSQNAGRPNSILSPNVYSDFEFGSTLSSNDSDNDAIGLVAAAKIVNNRPHLLIAMRTQSGVFGIRSYAIVYYNGATNTHRTILEVPGESISNRWSGARTYVNIIRKENVFHINATKFKGGSFDEIVLDLDAYPELEVFKGPSRYGFYTYSQAGSTYLSVKQPYAGARVVDLSTNTVWESQNGTWVQVGTDMQLSEIIEPPRIILNPETGKTFYVYYGN